MSHTFKAWEELFKIVNKYNFSNCLAIEALTKSCIKELESSNMTEEVLYIKEKYKELMGIDITKSAFMDFVKIDHNLLFSSFLK